MARTTSEDIGEIIELDATIDVTPFITIANELVTELCVGKGYTEGRLALIETWLAAHFYCVRDPRVTSESAGVSASYEGSAGMYLERSRYGQQAMVLDTAGGLAALNKKSQTGGARRISIAWLGTEQETEE